MFKGTVIFQARIRGNGLTFPLGEFKPSEPGVDKVEIKAEIKPENGDESVNVIECTVHLPSMATREAGIAMAMKVSTMALNRISFLHSKAIENEKITGMQFSPLNPTPGALYAEAGCCAIVGQPVGLVDGISAEGIKAELEQKSPPGEKYYGLLRSARQSTSPVEEFMHLYNVLLMLCNKGLSRELQENVDKFILVEEPAVQQTPHPLFRGVSETVYTRLRNEFGHARAGVNLDDTKAEMTTHLAGLIAITKCAIENS